jgi:hypothetical protein
MTDVFSDPKPEESKEPTQGNQTTEDILSQLVGEGKKFKTVEDLARGKLEADRFISDLTEEQKELRNALKEYEEKLAKTETVKDLFGNKDSASSKDNQAEQMTTEDILKLVDERLTKRTAAQQEAANKERANAALLKHFGNDDAKARAFVKSEAERLGVGTDFLKDMSAKSPEAFLRLVGVNQPRANPGASFDNAVNPDASGGEGSMRNAAYYSELRKKLGHRFYEPDIQQQRLRDRKALGERFFT